MGSFRPSSVLLIRDLRNDLYVLTDRPRLGDDLSIGATETYRI